MPALAQTYLGPCLPSLRGVCVWADPALAFDESHSPVHSPVVYFLSRLPWLCGAQVRMLLKSLGSHHAPPGFADKLLFSGIDTDGNGLIDRVEWVNFVAKQSKVYGERGMFKLLQTMRNEMDQKWGLPK